MSLFIRDHLASTSSLSYYSQRRSALTVVGFTGKHLMASAVLLLLTYAAAAVLPDDLFAVVAAMLVILTGWGAMQVKRALGSFGSVFVGLSLFATNAVVLFGSFRVDGLLWPATPAELLACFAMLTLPSLVYGYFKKFHSKH